MTTISLLTILCQSASIEELETTARELGCMELRMLYGAVHMRLPDGQVGSFRVSHARGIGINGNQFVWCSSDSAE